MSEPWKVTALSLATRLAVMYIFCAIFDALFPPFGLIAALAPASPWPITGSPRAFLTGFGLFSIAGLVLGALWGHSGILEQKTAVTDIMARDPVSDIQTSFR